ncbi:protein TAPT1 homolog [Anabrus simplex]|uniref:protein TAPT1 homolog n=1 Tax=Anabrus simplex TaxID=316456 RepID=UPI0034DD0799
MSRGDAFPEMLPERKIRFRSNAKTYHNDDGRVEDLHCNSDVKSSEHQPSLLQFLNVELTRSYLLEHDEERFSARREKIYSFMKIPREVEKFMAYGFFQCADSFLFVYTFLPLRFLLALWALISRPLRECFGFKVQKYKSKGVLKPAEICDLLKACILIVCSMLMSYIDTSMMYHLIKSQSVIKLYIFFNMLEVGDRLFSAFGQDTIDALFWTATEPRDRKREHLGLVAHLFFAVAYVLLHSLLVLFQATTLNVAINSNNKALLTIMMSNNFVELKGSVFKKFDKNNLFQVSCSDVRERFHLFVLLFIVVLQTMKEYSWKEERFWVLVPDCLMVLLAEVFVDWIKHAFITRFNELPVDVYRDYTISLAYDMAQTRQEHAFSDHSDLVARRMGFIPLPLGVVMVRVLAHAVHVEGPAAIMLVILSYLCLASFRVLNSVVILGKACDLISQHQHDKALSASTTVSMQSRATSPLVVRELFKDSPRNNGVTSLQRSVTVDTMSLSDDLDKKDVTKDKPSECNLGPAAIFSNSAVSINNVCLNEALLCEELGAVKRMESVKEASEGHEECLTRSVPNIQANFNSETKDSFLPEVNSVLGEDLSKKRAESEPSIPHLVDSERTGSSQL